MANPTGGAVVAGSATIGSAGLTLNINQSSHNAIINWQQFSIASGETTKFFVPSTSSATLNRVVGGNPSAIYGTLQSNGIVYLVNPSGIVVGPGGRIDTSSFLASTLDVSNQQFLAGGSMSFAGSSVASIDNEGVIKASIGNVYLIANQVKNGGTISAPRGNVGMAAGSDILFQPAGGQHLFVRGTPAGTTRALGVTNAGTIQAATAELRAVGGNAYALAINNAGSIAATGYQKINGQVYLTAAGGNITNSGKISAQSAGGKGGTIVIDGSGGSSSGTVVNSGELNASATAAGAPGGSITIRNSGGTTVNTASGQILATGGSGAEGGTIETSGEFLQVDGTVSAGNGGNWLLDPTDVAIDNGSGVAPDVNVNTLETGLNAGTNETVQAVGGNTDSGNIDLNASLIWTSSATLQFTATGNINLNQPLSGTSGRLSLSAGGTISDTAALSVSSFILQNGVWDQTSATLPAFSASNDFELQNSSTFLRVTGGNGTSSPYQITDIYGLEGLASPSGSLLTANAELMNNILAVGTTTWNSGAGFVPIGNGSTYYSGAFNGQDHTIAGLFIDNPNASYLGLFGVASGLLENVNLIGVQITGNSAVGALVGAMGNAVAGTQGTGSIVHVSSDGTIAGGGGYIGGIAGFDHGTAITSSYSAGTVSGSSFVGGLEGSTLSLVSDVYSTASVSGSGVVGGLVGENYYSTVRNAYSTAPVTGSSETGALVGRNLGTVENSFWDTATSGITSPTGGIGSGMNAGVTGATTAQLESQSFILANSPSSPTWDFTNVWTTNGGTTFPQLIGVGSAGSPNAQGGESGGSTSTSSTTTGPVYNSGSNIVPPALTPQLAAAALYPGSADLGNTTPPTLLNFVGNGTAGQLGPQAGGLASSSSNGGLVGSDDAAQLGNGQLNNVANPQAAGTLNLALGPVVYHNLSDALTTIGDWAEACSSPDDDNSSAGGDETILSGGDVAEIGDQGIKNIPLSQAPQQLKNAMSENALNGIPGNGY